jgi:hypothetical protein
LPGDFLLGWFWFEFDSSSDTISLLS